MSEERKPSKQLNFNSFLSLVLMGAMTWVGVTLTSGNEKLAKLSERLAIMETINSEKVEQLSRIETQLSHQQVQINDMAMDLARIKGSKP